MNVITIGYALYSQKYGTYCPVGTSINKWNPALPQNTGGFNCVTPRIFSEPHHILTGIRLSADGNSGKAQVNRLDHAQAVIMEVQVTERTGSGQTKIDYSIY